MRLTIAALGLLAATPAFATADPARYMPAELVAETLAPKPGSTILVGFRMAPKPGWHGYWSNPGDSGIAPSVEWSAAKGLSFGRLLHPPPTLISADGISSYVHEGAHVLLARMRIGRGGVPGTPLPIEAKLSWAACTATQCVPLHATFSLDLVAGDGTPSADSAALERAERALPKSASAGTFMVEGKTVRLELPASAKLSLRTTRFFPDDNDSFRTAAARVSDDGRAIVAPFGTEPSNTMSGVLTDGRTSYRLAFHRTEPIAQTQSLAPTPRRVEASSDASPSTPSPRLPETQAAPPVENHARWLALAIVLIGVVASGLALRRRKPR